MSETPPPSALEDSLPHPEAERPDVHRSILTWSVSVLALLATIWALYSTRALVLPVLVALLLYFLLAPLVRLLGRLYIPRSLGAGLILLLGVGLLVAGGYFLSAPAIEWMQDLPTSTAELQRQVKGYLEPVQQAQEATIEATRQMESLTGVEKEKGTDMVRIEEPGRVETLVADAGEFASSTVIAWVLLYFLLATDGSFLRRLVQTVPNLAEKDLATGFLRRFEKEISRYLITATLINILLGVLVGLALYAVGLPNAILWGVLVALLNFIPYLGSAVGVVVVAIVALGSVEPTSRALLAPLAYLLLTAAEGTLVTPSVMGSRLTLSPVAIFVWLMLWNWIWGFPGALLAIPLLVVVKVFCDNFPSLEPVGRLLGRG